MRRCSCSKSQGQRTDELSVEGSNRIQEISHNVRWSRGATLPAALNGSSIAAVVHQLHNQWRFRVYYQAESLDIREQCFNMGQNNNWFAGASLLSFALSMRCLILYFVRRSLQRRQGPRPHPDRRSLQHLARHRARRLLAERERGDHARYPRQRDHLAHHHGRSLAGARREIRPRAVGWWKAHPAVLPGKRSLGARGH